MKCPSCANGRLEPSFIDQLFRAHTCNECGGNWILIEDYVAWKDHHQDHSFTSISVEEVEESSKALLCPMTGMIMRKLRISKDNAHRVDYSKRVGGVWLDKGEWELLKKEGLAGSLNAILTEQWQQKIKAQQTEETFDLLYLSKFGESDYQKIKDVRAWLEAHPQKTDLRSFLLSDDPYSVR